VNTKTQEVNNIYKATWLDGEDIAFEGIFKLKVSGFNIDEPDNFWDWTFSVHCVMQGQGEYSGETLRLSFEGPATEMMINGMTGYLLIR